MLCNLSDLHKTKIRMICLELLNINRLAHEKLSGESYAQEKLRNIYFYCLDLFICETIYKFVGICVCLLFKLQSNL